MPYWKKILPVLFLLALMVWVAVLRNRGATGQPSPERQEYLYEDTRQLVALVEEAAGLMEQQGPGIYPMLSRKGSRWFHDDLYFFVYDLQGNCLFHPVEPQLVGRNLLELKDLNGKPVGRMVNEIGKLPSPRAGGWVFYLWEEGQQITPMWKSSYIRKVIGPDHKIYLIGCGSYKMKIEKEFVREKVDRAAELLRTGDREAAFEKFRDPASPFCFLGIYIFVMNMEGKTVVDPSYPTGKGRDLSNFRDAVGRYVFRETIQKLQTDDTAWAQYLWYKPGSSHPSRKLLYVRKVKVDYGTLMVGADFDLATPIWMSD